MIDERLATYLSYIRESATQARAYVDGLSKEDFLEDRRTQQAVILNLLIMGEAASKVLDEHAEFATTVPAIPWRSMKGMRNRIAHGYFEIDIETVWDTVDRSLAELLAHWPDDVASIRGVDSQ